MNIDSADMMNLMLYHTCAQTFDGNSNKVFIYDLHCKTLEITAEFVSVNSNDNLSGIEYRILDYKLY